MQRDFSRKVPARNPIYIEKSNMYAILRIKLSILYETQIIYDTKKKALSFVICIQRYGRTHTEKRNTTRAILARNTRPATAEY